MLALVMAGGRGSRMGYLEKPMIEVKGRRLVDYVIDEIEYAGITGIFITSPFTPQTERYLSNLGMEVFRGKGRGYIDDLFFAIEKMEITSPIMNVNSDLFIARMGLINEFLNAYMKSRMPSMACVYRDGRYVGINAFNPILGEQDEEKFFIDERDVINIDTIDDLRRAKNG